MTYPSDPHNPWVFHRDEVDLLEEDIEDIYRDHHDQPKQRTAIEDQVLKEQLETEELSDAELMLKMGSDMFELQERGSGHAHAQEVSIPMTPRVQRNPLYVHARLWAQQVYRLAKETYHRRGIRSRDVFRVYINVNMIPIKLSMAQNEELQEDALSFEIAEKEYVLALTYFDRVLESIEPMLAMLVSTPEGVRAQGQALRNEVFRAYQQLQRRKGKGRTGSV